jgi:hypothetical protein
MLIQFYFGYGKQEAFVFPKLVVLYIYIYILLQGNS